MGRERDGSPWEYIFEFSPAESALLCLDIFPLIFLLFPSSRSTMVEMRIAGGQQAWVLAYFLLFILFNECYVSCIFMLRSSGGMGWDS